MNEDKQGAERMTLMCQHSIGYRCELCRPLNEHASQPVGEAVDIAKFDELIDAYQCAQKDGTFDERVQARATLKNAYRAALQQAAPSVAQAGLSAEPLPEMASRADFLDMAPHEWDDGHRVNWADLQAATINKLRWRKMALKLRAILARSGQPAQEGL